MNKLRTFETTSFSLHCMAMFFMLLDHLWGTVVPGNDWMTCLGRITYPIYAFLLVEGYFHTSNLKKYAGRLLLFALISEIPFNLAMGSRLIYPIHQNVLFSYLISLGLIHWNEQAKKSGKGWKRYLTVFFSLLLATVLGILTFVDFYSAGILMVLVFYYFRGRTWKHWLLQFLFLWYINIEMLAGYEYLWEVSGQTIHITRQGFALLALIPIWLYRGKQGAHSTLFRQFCYWFYPVHLLILGLWKFFL